MEAKIENSSILTLKSIYDILGLKFIIPRYQRGYRWTKNEVEQLLNDIWDFHNKTDKKSGEFYCLQPIVVRKITENEYEVIDGQQRLTTIHIILSYFESIFKKPLKESHSKEKFSIDYQTRPQSRDFLNNIEKCNINDTKNNIDFFYMIKAYDAIETWFKEKNFTDDDKYKFRAILLGQLNKEQNYPVVFIWYELDENQTEPIKDTKLIDVFTRLNIGKIPLTNSELVKALLLRNANFPENIANLKQIQIATEWDLIEKSLQDDNFWYFIYNLDNPLKYENRIEYLLDLLSEKKASEEYYFTFLYFLNKLNKKSIDDTWLEIKKYHLTFEEWYKDFELYHYIGFLIDSNEKIQEILNQFKTLSKNEFKKWIKEKIKKLINCSENDLYELEYGDKKIKRILLLFNILTIMNSKNTDFKFSFKNYKNIPWEVEHIRSQTDSQILGINKQKEWLKDILNLLGEEKTPKIINEIEIKETENNNELDTFSKELEKFKNTDNIDNKQLISLIQCAQFEYIPDEQFTELYKIVQRYFQEHKAVEDINKISNLALLNAEINRSYKNAFFPVKRRFIIENDKNGKFIPIATKNLFLKYYTKNATNAMYWTKEDADNYLTYLKETIKEFLKND